VKGRLERHLAALLHYGTWIASIVIAAGMALALAFATSQGMRIVALGIGLFILLPVVRVLVMLIAFLRAGDYRLGGFAALVLAIITLGFTLGR